MVEHNAVIETDHQLELEFPFILNGNDKFNVSYLFILLWMLIEYFLAQVLRCVFPFRIYIIS